MSQSSGFSYAFNPNRNQYIEQEQDDDGQGGGEDVSNVQDQHEQFQFEQEDEDGRQYQYGDGGDQASFEEEAQMKRNYGNTYAEFENDEDATTKSMVQAANQQHSSYGHGYGDELKTRPGQEMNYLVADESIESVDTQYQTHVHKLLIQRETLLNQLNTEQSIKIELAKELEQVQLLTAQAQREGSLIVAYGTSLRAQLLAGEKNLDFEKKELIVLEAEDEKLAKKVAEHRQRIVNVKTHSQSALDHSRKQFQARQASIERHVAKIFELTGEDIRSEVFSGYPRMADVLPPVKPNPGDGNACFSDGRTLTSNANENHDQSMAVGAQNSSENLPSRGEFNFIGN